MTIKDHLAQTNAKFYKHLTRNTTFGLMSIAVALGMGMLGYHGFENMAWSDAFVNAAMILSGMGPVDPLKTEGGKIFAGSYALFSGIVFLVIIAVIVAPVFHRFLHKFLIDQKR